MMIDGIDVAIGTALTAGHGGEEQSRDAHQPQPREPRQGSKPNHPHPYQPHLRGDGDRGLEVDVE